MADEEKAVSTRRLATFLTQIKEIFAKKVIYDDDHVSLGRKANTIIGSHSVATGKDTTAEGRYSHAEGEVTNARGHDSHAEGYGGFAKGLYSHAEGYCTHATENSSHSEGISTAANSSAAHAEGCSTRANGFCSHAEGYLTLAGASYSHAEGRETTASGDTSHAEGHYTIASGFCSHVQGKYNVQDTKNKYAHIVGNGTGLSARSNAHTLDWEGNAWFAGDVENGNGVSLNGLKALIESMETGGASGTTDYTQLENKPKINGVELTGNITLAELGIQEMTYEETLAALNETEEAA